LARSTASVAFAPSMMDCWMSSEACLAATAAREVGYATVYAQAEETRPAGTVARTFVTSFDADRIFRSLLGGAFDRWEEWF